MRLLLSGYGGKTGETAQVYDLQKRIAVWKSGVESVSFMCAGDGGAFFGAGEFNDHGFAHMFIPDGAAPGGYRLADSRRVDGTLLCHIAYSSKHKILTGACYGSGDIFSLEVKPDCFGEMKSYVRQGGVEAEVTRAHCAVFGKDEDELYSANIALDKIYRYEIKNGELRESGFQRMDKGVGPRHIIIINGWRYVITEYSNEIIALNGDYRRVSALPDGFGGKSNCSGMAYLPVCGEYGYLYAANRGADTVAVFKQYNRDGTLEKIHDCHCGGSIPRHIEVIDMDGTPVLISANQRSGGFVFFNIGGNGRLGESFLTVPFGGASYVSAL